MLVSHEFKNVVALIVITKHSFYALLITDFYQESYFSNSLIINEADTKKISNVWKSGELHKLGQLAP